LANLQDATHLGGDDQDTVGVRQRTAGQPGTRAAGDERHPEFVADPHAVLDLVGVLREHHHRRGDPVVRQAVALVGA